MINFTCKAKTLDNDPYRTYIKSALIGLIMRSITNFAYIFSMIHWNTGDVNVTATAINFISSIVYERIFLKVKPHWLTIVGTLVGSSGLVASCKPSGGNEDYELITNLLILTVIAIGATFNSIYLGYLQKTKNISTSWHCCFYACGLTFVGPFLFMGKKEEIFWEPCGTFNRLSGVMGAMIYLYGTLSGIVSSQKSLPSVMFILKLFSVVLVYFLNFVFISSSISILSLVGAFAILFALCLQSIILYKCPDSMRHDFECN